MDGPDDSFASLGSFAEPALHVLTVLAKGPSDGLTMSRDISILTGRRPGPGALYGAIARLEERGWIAPFATSSGCLYRLTSVGEGGLRARTNELRAAVVLGQPRLAHVWGTE
jgi:DNA-binding PadR family transcriptional regulator